jgi:hypothetical protein
MDTTLELPSSSSTPWCGGLLDSAVGCVIFPNSGDSSATPVSSSVAVVHLWPKVSTPSRSPCRFLSVLPFPCAFGGHSHLIPIFFFSICSIPVNLQPPWEALPELSARPCAWPTLGLCSAHPRASPARHPSRLHRLVPSEGRAAGARVACRRRCLPAAGRDSATSAPPYCW